MSTQDDRPPVDTGGPAFPVDLGPRSGEHHDCNEGMSLRDYFAAEAMQPLMRTTQRGGKTGPDAGTDDFEWVARRAYWMADAMLAARKAGAA